MPQYRVYKISAASRISAPPEIVLSDDDEEALEKANQLVNGSAIEIWESDRLVGRLPRD